MTETRPTSSHPAEVGPGSGVMTATPPVSRATTAAPRALGARTEARLAPGGRHETGTLVWAFSQAAGLVAGTKPPNLFLTLGRHRRLFRGWLRFAGRLMPGGLLPRRETELVILRVAHLRSCAYEFEHHVRMGRRAGIHTADVARIVAGPDAAGWSPRERALLCAVEELHRDRDIDDGTWVTLRTHLDERACIELCLLVGHYEMLATTIAALRIQPDRPRRRVLRKRRG